MDFFADGGFQQLFCDLNEQLEQDYNNWQPQQFTNDHNNNNNNKLGCCLTTAYDENEANICLLDETLNNYSPQIMDLNEKELQTSLDYLLSNSPESLWDYESCLPSFSSVSKDLCDWEEKFLDNFIEIPELVDILPEKTPLCTDNCNHFLQESAKNLKLPAAALNVNDVDVDADADDKSYVCSFGDCHKVYAKPAHLKAHLRRHLGEKPYICDWPNCTWKFSRSDELARHRRSHSGVKPYKCDFCAKCFARSDHLTKHRKVHERRLLAASKAGKTLINGQLPASVLTVRPGRKKKNQL